QAEDGIRDFHVTGVQTCALPICPASPGGPGERPVLDRLRRVPLPGGIHPRAGRIPGPAGRRHEHGTVAVPAHGAGRRGFVRAQCKATVPLTEMLTVTLPASSGTSADSAAALLAIIWAPMGRGTGTGEPPPLSSSCRT